MTLAVGGDSATTDKRLSFRALHSFADAESLRPAWNDLVLRCGADVYQTFEWCQIWCSTTEPVASSISCCVFPARNW